MENSIDAALLAKLLDLTGQAAANDYSRVEELYELTRAGQGSEVIRQLAEAFGMMVVQIEGRQFRLERLIEDLKLANQRLEAALQQIRAADMAKQKVIDHLSHELKTPLAVISSALRHLSNKLPEKSHPKLAKTIDRGLRNVSRLVAVQDKVDDIINSKDNNSDKARYQRIIEGLSDMAEELSEQDAAVDRRVLDRISARIESIYRSAPVSPTTIGLNQFIEDIISQALEAASSRDVRINTDLAATLFIEMDPTVLSKVFSGILKNAIENTPDGGSIHISAVSNKGEVFVFFRDTGVGITRDDLKSVFGGFFHTQETYMYATKKPYQFNAGGTGSDLLRIKTFSERFGFKVALSSRRCGFLQPDTEQCPGALDSCRHIHAGRECAGAGGTEVTLRFAGPESWTAQCPQPEKDDGKLKH